MTKVLSVLSDRTYLIRKVETHNTQCVHRKLLRLFNPPFSIDDIYVSKQVYPDSERVEETDINESNIPRLEETDRGEET